MPLLGARFAAATEALLPPAQPAPASAAAAGPSAARPAALGEGVWEYGFEAELPLVDCAGGWGGAGVAALCVLLAGGEVGNGHCAALSHTCDSGAPPSLLPAALRCLARLGVAAAAPADVVARFVLPALRAARAQLRDGRPGEGEGAGGLRAGRLVGLAAYLMHHQHLAAAQGRELGAAADWAEALVWVMAPPQQGLAPEAAQDETAGPPHQPWVGHSDNAASQPPAGWRAVAAQEGVCLGLSFPQLLPAAPVPLGPLRAALADLAAALAAAGRPCALWAPGYLRFGSAAQWTDWAGLLRCGATWARLQPGPAGAASPDLEALMGWLGVPAGPEEHKQEPEAEAQQEGRGALHAEPPLRPLPAERLASLAAAAVTLEGLWAAEYAWAAPPGLPAPPFLRVLRRAAWLPDTWRCALPPRHPAALLPSPALLRLLGPAARFVARPPDFAAGGEPGDEEVGGGRAARPLPLLQLSGPLARALGLAAAPSPARVLAALRQWQLAAGRPELAAPQPSAADLARCYAHLAARLEEDEAEDNGDRDKPAGRTRALLVGAFAVAPLLGLPSGGAGGAVRWWGPWQAVWSLGAAEEEGPHSGAWATAALHHLPPALWPALAPPPGQPGPDGAALRWLMVGALGVAPRLAPAQLLAALRGAAAERDAGAALCLLAWLGCALLEGQARELEAEGSGQADELAAEAAKDVEDALSALRCEALLPCVDGRWRAAPPPGARPLVAVLDRLLAPGPHTATAHRAAHHAAAHEAAGGGSGGRGAAEACEAALPELLRAAAEAAGGRPGLCVVGPPVAESSGEDLGAGEHEAPQPEAAALGPRAAQGLRHLLSALLVLPALSDLAELAVAAAPGAAVAWAPAAAEPPSARHTGLAGAQHPPAALRAAAEGLLGRLNAVAPLLEAWAARQAKGGAGVGPPHEGWRERAAALRVAAVWGAPGEAALRRVARLRALGCEAQVRWRQGGHGGLAAPHTSCSSHLFCRAAHKLQQPPLLPCRWPRSAAGRGPRSAGAAVGG